MKRKKGFFGWFNRTFSKGTHKYESVVAKVLKHAVPMLVVYAALGGVAGLLYKNIPDSFLPQEDQGSLMMMVQLPAGATKSVPMRLWPLPTKSSPKCRRWKISSVCPASALPVLVRIWVSASLR